VSDRLFDVEEYPEAPVLRPPRGRKGAAVGASLDARFLNDYPPEWRTCPGCEGSGRTYPGVGALLVEATSAPCSECKGMGSVKARVRLEAGHRCERCRHPYMPKGDAAMLGVSPSGLHDCERCAGRGLIPMLGGEDPRDALVCEGCKGTGKAWNGWSFCDDQCVHDGPFRVRYGRPANPEVWVEDPLPDSVGRDVPVLARFDNALEVEAVWRVLTVHHLDGDKANLRWWNLAALCQRCHLEIQAKVVMERVYPHEHSGWFKPHAAGYYAWVYNGEELTREETLERLDELLALELA
jgi:hypothetical protein